MVLFVSLVILVLVIVGTFMFCFNGAGRIR